MKVDVIKKIVLELSQEELNTITVALGMTLPADIITAATKISKTVLNITETHSFYRDLVEIK